MTKKEAIEKHRELWNKIADMTEKQHRFISKYEALKELYEEYDHEDISNDCFCCEFANFKCDICPIKWPKTSELYSFCDCCNSYYDSWEKCSDTTRWRKAARIARTIANLPEREG